MAGSMELAEQPKASTGLPEVVARRGITEAAWRTLCNNLYPGADPQSVLMVVDYCAARKLDPLKKPCHIVPMRVKDARTGEYGWRDVVMPGIYEYRITAQRTGIYLGHSRPEYGPIEKIAGVEAPSSCAMTFYRWNASAQRQVDYPVEVFFAEVVATGRDGGANERWKRAPRQMLTKCAEAAGLREAFPEEFGGESTAEEMDGRTVAAGGEEDQPATQQPIRPTTRVSQRAPAVAAPSAVADGVVVDADERAEGDQDAQADAPTSAAAPPAAGSREPAAEVKRLANIGRISDMREVDGGALFLLNTGFKFGTVDVDMIAALARFKADGAVIEVTAAAPSRPNVAGIVSEVSRLD